MWYCIKGEREGGWEDGREGGTRKREGNGVGEEVVDERERDGGREKRKDGGNEGWIEM